MAQFNLRPPRRRIPHYSTVSPPITPITISGTIFEGRQLRPSQAVLLIRGVLKGESAATLARELEMSRTTVTELRHLIQANAAQLQSEMPLKDNVVEADELFQNAGEKR